jgi:hypothetical protein
MEKTADEKNEWVGILTLLCGAAVIVPSMIALAITILTLLVYVFW